MSRITPKEEEGGTQHQAKRGRAQLPSLHLWSGTVFSSIFGLVLRASLLLE